MKKKIVLISILIAIILSIILIFILIQIQLKNKKDQSLYQNIKKISLYHYFSGSLSGGFNDMINIINQNQDEFEIESNALDHEAFKTMIHTTIVKESTPELFTYWSGAKVQELVDNKEIQSFDDIWNKENLDKKFSKSVINAACTYNNKKYLLPITQYVAVFFYNKNIFEDNNITPPKTWNEFLIICEKLKNNNIKPISLGSRERWPAQFWFDYLLLRTAGAEYREKLMKGEASYTDKKVIKVYKIWGSLIQKKYFNDNANKLDWAEATELICNNQAAMTLMGSWALQLFTNEKNNMKPGKDFDFFAFPIINENIPRSIVGPIDGIVLSKKSVNLEISKEAIILFAQKEPQLALSRGSGSLAPNIAIPRSFYSNIQQRLLDEIELCDNWAFNYDLATPISIAELGMDSFQELIEFPDQYKAILENIEKEINIQEKNKP